MKNNEKQLNIILYISIFLAFYKKSCNNLSKDLELLLFLSISSFLSFIYIFFRFIRPRLPKDIPISLTEFYFYILLMIFIKVTYILHFIFMLLMKYLQDFLNQNQL